ncbi:MAG: restriction endonuclease subunit M, partial [Chloroflexota bacterium]
MSPAPQAVVELVERFNSDRALYRTANYNEAQARTEFVDPLFEALGWDMRNAQGRPFNQREVQVETNVRVRGVMRSPDYRFQLGQDQFYVEAKKPAVDVQADIGPAFQLRSYAWSKKLPLSVLTDFEEFSIYDCRTVPKAKDGTHVGRLKYITFEEYPARW